MKYVYYLNGVKVRTSENYYSHAVVYRGKVIACCGSEYLALKRLHQEFHYREQQLDQAKDNKSYNSLLSEWIQTLHISVLERKDSR